MRELLMDNDEHKVANMEEENSAQNEEKQEQVQQRELPHDVIIHHILPYQSIKSLTQYKLVSKQWYSSLTSSNFILHHTKQPLFSHLGPPVETLFIQTGNHFYLYSCKYDDNVELVETFDMFPQLTMRSPMSDMLCVMDGCISKCQEFESLDILLVDIVKCLGRVVSVRLPCDLSWSRVHDMIGLTKTGKILVAYSDPRKPGVIDLRAIGLSGSSRKSLAKFRYQGRARIESYVPSQISPLPPTEFSEAVRQNAPSVESILQRAKEERDTAVREMQQLQQELEMLRRHRSNSGFSRKSILIAATIGLMLGFLWKPSLPSSTTA